MPLPDALNAQLKMLGTELDRRANHHAVIEDYYTGDCPLPPSIVRARVTNAYKMLMSVSQTNYARLVVRAATSRMEVGGIRTGDDELDQKAWNIWQANRLDAESRRAHDSILTHGRAFAIIRPGETEYPEITLEDSATCIVEYREGSRYDRLSALRRWKDDNGDTYATLYSPDGTLRLKGQNKDVSASDQTWELIEELPNKFGIVPVVELAVNRRLRPGRFGYAAGDFAGSTGLLDRINVLEFLRMVIAFTSGFPVRAVIGDKILRDDDGNAIAPFKLGADIIAQFENPETKLVELAASDVKAFGDALNRDVEALAGITQTPAYYLRSVPIQNVSADAIRASDAPLNARVEDHKPDLSEGWEEVDRTALLMYDGSDLPDTAEMQWVNRESRSLSERADAATKLKDIMPWQFIAENVFDLTQEEISRYEELRATDALTTALATVPTEPTEPSPNGRPTLRPVA